MRTYAHLSQCSFLWVLAGQAVDRLSHQFGVADVTDVLLDEVEQDSARNAGRRHSLLVEAPETAEPAGSAQTSSPGNGCLLVRGPVAGLKPTTALASAVANDKTCTPDYLVLS